MELGKGRMSIAVDGGYSSLSAFKWAIDCCLCEDDQCVLVHVRAEATENPENVLIDHELQELFEPYRRICADNGIKVKELVLRGNDVAATLINYIVTHNIRAFVIGASARNDSVRGYQSADIPSTILKSTPEWCAVYVISRREFEDCGGELPETPISDATFMLSQCSTAAIGTPQQCPSPVRFTTTGRGLPPQKAYLEFSDSFSSGNLKFDVVSSDCFNPGSWGSEILKTKSCRRNNDYLPGSVDKNTATDYPQAKLVTPNQRSSELFEKKPISLASELSGPRSFQSTDVSSENSRLSRISSNELKSFRSLYKEDEEASKLKKYNSLTSKPLPAILRSKLAEGDAKKLEKAISLHNHRYKKYTIEEIEEATANFASMNKLGEDGFGPVFLGKIDNKSVAVKVFNPTYSQGHRQFQKEVEILSTRSHQHKISLLGACVEYGCAVYEYMENGTLEDRLFRKDNTPPIPWRIRFRIACEIAIGLNFLHETKPEPLVHRDLKPANIFLTKNYTSKISDFGLARLVANNNSENYLAAAASSSTVCYIDPEFKKSGKLCVKSDIYSFGILLSQLLTARPPMGIASQAEEAVKNGTFADILDPALTDWPVEEALSLAKLALKCCEMRKDDRPDLATVVLPELSRLRDFSNNIHKPRTFPEQHIQKTQINEKKSWQYVAKNMAKSLFRSNSQKSKSTHLNRSSSKSKKPESISCCSSFVNHAPKLDVPVQKP